MATRYRLVLADEDGTVVKGARGCAMRCAVCGLFNSAGRHKRGDHSYEHDFDPAIPASKVRALAKYYVGEDGAHLDDRNGEWVSWTEIESLLREIEGGA